MRPTKPRSLAVFLCTLFALALSWMGSPAWAAKAPRDTPLKVGTWNIQNGASRKWTDILKMSRDQYVLALQEAPLVQPAGSVATHRNDLPPGVVEYRVPATRPGGNDERYVYLLADATRNLGLVTAYRAPAVYVIDSVYRPALATMDPASGVLFASIHAAAGSAGNGNTSGGNDVGALLRRIDQFAQSSGHSFWSALGDFNREPENLGNMLPANTWYYRSGQATHTGGSEFDYMVSNIDMEQGQWAATVGSNHDSDHWPVYFSPLQAAGKPIELIIQSKKNGRVLEAHAPEGKFSEVVADDFTGEPNQRWMLDALKGEPGDNTTFYQIYNPDTQECLDFDRRAVDGPGGPAGSSFFWASPRVATCAVPPFSGGRTGETLQHFGLIPVPGPDHNATQLFDEWGGFLYEMEWGNEPDRENPMGNAPARPNDPAQIYYLHPVIKEF